MAEPLSLSGVVHLAAVLPALAVGAFVLSTRKGTQGHKRAGWFWIILMLSVDISAFFLQRDGYSWVHMLAFINLTSITAGFVFIKRRKLIAHSACMVGAYLGTVAAGVGALMPGRYLHAVLFAG